MSSFALGDAVERALTLAGFGKDRVERWLGRPCGCRERQDRLNQLGFLAAEILRGNLRARNFISAIITSDESGETDP